MQNMSSNQLSYTGVKSSGPKTAPDHEPTTTTHGNGTTPRRKGGKEGREELAVSSKNKNPIHRIWGKSVGFTDLATGHVENTLV